MQDSEPGKETRLGWCRFINPDTNLFIDVELRENTEGGEKPFRVVNYIGDTEFSEQQSALLPEAYRNFAAMVIEFAEEKEAKDGERESARLPGQRR